MAYCTNCGNQLREGAKFCDKCGYQVGAYDDGSKRQTVFEGNIHKCPNCGEIIDAFTTTCPSCNFEIRGVNATSSVKELALKLSDCETSEQKIDLIKNFYIPNTKEDIYEFFILAKSNIESGDEDIEAWSVKLEQAYQKAKLSFNGTREFQELSLIYKKTQKKKNFKRIEHVIRKSNFAKALTMVLMGVIVIIIGAVGAEISNDSNSLFYVFPVIGMLLIMAGIFSLLGQNNNSKKK